MATPQARVVLLGSKSPNQSHLFSKDPDAVIFSEILEFALSLIPVAKGQEPFSGLPHLQAYRLMRATQIAETGDIKLANQYCEAISASLSKPSPYFNATFANELRLLIERINGVAHSDKSGSWIGNKISKPSLGTIGNWFVDKLVTGDTDGEHKEEEDSKKAAQRTFDGPFSQFSNISSNAPSARSSPQPQFNAYAQPPQRTSSAMSMSSTFLPPPQPIDRASSAMDYMRDNRQQGGGPPAPSFSAYGGYHPNHSTPALGANTTSQYAPAQQQRQAAFNGHARQGSTGTDGGASTTQGEQELETPVQTQGSSWWDYSSQNAATPTASSFANADEPTAADAGGGGSFVSLMDAPQFGYAPKSASAPPVQTQQRYNDFGDDDDDLGLGNSRKNSRLASPAEEDHKPEPQKQAASPPAESKPAAAASAQNGTSRSRCLY